MHQSAIRDHPCDTLNTDMGFVHSMASSLSRLLYTHFAMSAFAAFSIEECGDAHGHRPFSWGRSLGCAGPEH